MKRMRISGAVLLVAAIGVLGWRGAAVSAAGVRLPDAAVDDTVGAAHAAESIVLAGGCFWGVEEVFQHVRGVTDAVSGYSGGSARTAKYDIVSSGTSGHAESVKVTYDPAKISLGRILQVFFSVVHDPTELDRQGPDVGPQYRSAIFYASERQHQIARAYIDQLTASRAFRSAIVTEVVPLAGFYRAEEYHQDFAEKNPNHRYIVLIDKPKVADLHLTFPALYR